MIETMDARPAGPRRMVRFDPMELKLYDTLTREKRIFKPLDPANVRMYVCGPTVYDFAHIGNARPVIVFDVLFRLLRHLYCADHVTYVRNITDVDDKINARAAEEYPDLPLNEAIRKVTDKTDRQFHEDVAALGCLPPTVEPRATENIAEMRTLIERLVASGHAYVAEDNVLFSVPSMPDYGALSKRPLDEMIAGARVEVAPYKKDPQDFILWKSSKFGEPAWPSPCGIAAPGRPGWHIECSAMSWKYLGEVLDIHGGGIDLVFPHHENEIAQSRCAFHTPAMANFWMHNGFLQVEGEKMAKSAGNFVTIHELLRELPGDIIRLQMLKTHYRQPIDWTNQQSRETAAELGRWFGYVEKSNDEGQISLEVLSALCDDLNTPAAIAALRSVADDAQRGSMAARGVLRRTCEFLGFRNLQLSGYFQHAIQGVNVSIDLLKKHHATVTALRAAMANRFEESLISELKKQLESDGLRADVSDTGWVTLKSQSETEEDFERKVEALISRRNANRRLKDFKEADRIRDELAAMGVVLKDSKDGTTWEIAR
jgi:cysteinyl-tRNA synthetase